MSGARYRFGRFEFDNATLELRRDGALVRLQAQPAQVLATLLEQAGQVVSREQLRQAVWGNDTFVDFDRGLNFCVSQLRSALRDNASEPLFIRTLPKQGYQFFAPVERVDDNVAPVPTPAHIPEPRQRSRALTVALVFSGLVLVLGGGLWLHARRQPRHSPVVAVVRFDNETADSALTVFADGLTDNLVEQLTRDSNGRYGVIGNARILRLGRDQRDLKAIASSLNAGYVVLGQVQRSGARTRLLAHLIRLPDQNHLWVVRVDRTVDDPFTLEAELAAKIASEFSWRVAADSAPGASPLPALH